MRLAAATAGLAIGLAVGLAPVVAPRVAASRATPPATTAAALPVAAPVSAPDPRVLALPPGIIDADLSVMPDRYVNEPPLASFRLVVTVRGIPALVSVDPPAQIIWTEGGLSYRLTSRARTVAQLMDIASTLR